MLKRILWFIFMFCLFWYSFGQLTLQPNYSSERFQPSDKFHATCQNSIDFVFELSGQNIEAINAVLWYDKDSVKILSIDVEDKDKYNLSNIIEWDRITFNKLKSEEKTNKIVFKLKFEVFEWVENTTFDIVDGSYMLWSNGNSFDLKSSNNYQFQSVLECNPDIDPPRVEIVSPDIDEFVPLDTYFQFNVFDDGKWINKSSIEFILGETSYSLSDIQHEWDGEILTLYPDQWLPVDEEILIELVVADKQVYGKANITSQKYKIKTSSWLTLMNNIDPIEYRKLINKAKYYKWTKGECEVLQNYYWEDETLDWDIISINKKLECSKLIKKEKLEIEDEVIQSVDDTNNTISVFSVLWWILFVLFVFINLFVWISKNHKK